VDLQFDRSGSADRDAGKLHAKVPFFARASAPTARNLRPRPGAALKTNVGNYFDKESSSTHNGNH
jgi:hypothetical protein